MLSPPEVDQAAGRFMAGSSGLLGDKEAQPERMIASAKAVVGLESHENSVFFEGIGYCRIFAVDTCIVQWTTE